MFRLKVAVRVVALVALYCALPSQAADYKSVVQGVVKNSSGAPFTGAYVKLSNAEKRLTFLVVSQAQGRYMADHLPPGQYVVQGIGGGFQSSPSAPVEITEAKVATVDLSLTAPQAPFVPRRVVDSPQNCRLEMENGSFSRNVLSATGPTSPTAVPVGKSGRKSFRKCGVTFKGQRMPRI